VTAFKLYQEIPIEIITIAAITIHPASTYGIRLFAGMPEIRDPVRSYPLYCTPFLFLKPQVLGRFISKENLY
jgi:hypothetical protein